MTTYLEFLAIILYVIVAQFVFGCAHRLFENKPKYIEHMKSGWGRPEPFFCAVWWPVVVPFYIVFYLIGGAMKDAGYLLISKRLTNSAKKVAQQKNSS